MDKLVDVKAFKPIAIDKLVKADWNYKENNEELANKLIENIKRNGQIENILVRQLDTGFFEVVNGNHRLDALTSLGAKEVMCYDLGTITQQQAFRIAIETNETHFETDTVKLASLIGEILESTDAEELLKTFPFTQLEMDNFLKMNSFDWNSYQGDIQQTDESKPTEAPHLVLHLNKAQAEAWTEWKRICHNDCPEPAPSDAEVLVAALDIAMQRS